MTDTAEAAALPETVQENLEAFKRWAPHLYGPLAAVGAANSRLVADAEGRVDIVFRGQKFYGGDAEGYARRQLEDFFARDGTPRLVLITCGGRFNRSLNSYDDNVVVISVPLDFLEAT